MYTSSFSFFFFFISIFKCTSISFDTINHNVYTRISLFSVHSSHLASPVFSHSSLPPAFAFRSIAHDRFWCSPRGSVFLLARFSLLRLVAGPVTNHDSSARERRGHTTLGSGSGACCHPLREAPPPFELPDCHSSPWALPRPPAQLLRFATKSVAKRFQGSDAALLVYYPRDPSRVSSSRFSFLPSIPFNAVETRSI